MESKSKVAGAARLAGALLAAILLMAGLLFLWIWISYRIRFSAEVVRAGLFFAYIVPCFVAGKIIAKRGKKRSLLHGAGVGVLVYAVWAAAAIFFSIRVNGVLPQPDNTGVLPFALCVLSGLFGAVKPKKEK